MKIKTKYSLKEISVVILIIPFLLEATMIPSLLFQIPGSPLSMGRLSLVALGIVGLSLDYASLKRSRVFWSFIILVIGLLFGSLFSKSIGAELITFTGFGLLILASITSSVTLRGIAVKRLLDVYFIGSYLYWLYFIISFSISGGGLRSYGSYYRQHHLTDDSLINYHSFGLLLSCAVMYLTFRFFVKKSIGIGYILFMVVSLFALLLTESRANVIITLFVTVFFLFSYFGLSTRLILGGSVSLFVLWLVLGLVLSSNDDVERRFDVNDTEYIESSTSSRLEFISLSFGQLIKEPFGLGVSNNRVLYRGVYYQPHNQYLSFILSAGFIGLIAVILWVNTIVQYSVRVTRNKRLNYFPYLSMSWILMLTLMTNDVTGAFFFLILMIQVWMDFSAMELRDKLNRVRT